MPGATTEPGSTVVVVDFCFSLPHPKLNHWPDQVWCLEINVSSSLRAFLWVALVSGGCWSSCWCFYSSRAISKFPFGRLAYRWAIVPFYENNPGWQPNGVQPLKFLYCSWRDLSCKCKLFDQLPSFCNIFFHSRLTGFSRKPLTHRTRQRFSEGVLSPPSSERNEDVGAVRLQIAPSPVGIGLDVKRAFLHLESELEKGALPHEFLFIYKPGKTVIRSFTWSHIYSAYRR